MCVWIYAPRCVCVHIFYTNAICLCVCVYEIWPPGFNEGYRRGNSPKGRDPQPKGKHASRLPLIFALHAADTQTHSISPPWHNHTLLKPVCTHTHACTFMHLLNSAVYPCLLEIQIQRHCKCSCRH